MESIDITEKKFLTPGEAQAYLGCSRAFIYKLFEKNQIRKFKISKKTYLKVTDLDKLFTPEENA